MIESAVSEHIAVIHALSGMAQQIESAGQMCSNTLKKSGKLMLCGNGGSTADAQHIAAELVGRFVKNRRPLAAISLATDSSAMTCISNDFCFDQVFSRQVPVLPDLGAWHHVKRSNNYGVSDD